MNEHMEEYAFGLALTNAERTLDIRDAYYRVNAALLTDKAPAVVVPKSCKRCAGTGRVLGPGPNQTAHPVPALGFAVHGSDCPDCGGSGTTMHPIEDER